MDGDAGWQDLTRRAGAATAGLAHGRAVMVSVPCMSDRFGGLIRVDTLVVFNVQQLIQ